VLAGHGDDPDAPAFTDRAAVNGPARCVASSSGEGHGVERRKVCDDTDVARWEAPARARYRAR
jgi:hypothetical protein